MTTMMQMQKRRAPRIKYKIQVLRTQLLTTFVEFERMYIENDSN